MENTDTNKRKDWIDFARAIGIFAIVFGHMVKGKSVITLFFFSFRVPIFFSLMGLTFKYRKGFWSFIKRKAVRLLIPYYSFSIISIIIFTIIGKTIPSITEGQDLNILKNFFGCIYGNGMTGYMKWNLPLWFLPCGFLTIIIVYFFEGIVVNAKKNNQTTFRIFYIIISFIIGFVLSHFLKWLKLPFGAEVAVPMSGFVEIGILCVGMEKSISTKNAGIVGLWMVILGFILCQINGEVSVMSLNFGHNTVLFFFTAIIIIIGLFLLSIYACYCNKKNIFYKSICYCGRHTIAILCMHKFPILVFQYCVPYTKELLRSPGDSLQKNVVGIMLSMIVIVLCLIVEKPINRFCPIILGQSKDY